TALNADLPEVDGFTNVYFLNTVPSSIGILPFNFHTPFWWDGTSNIIIEFTYTNTTPGTDNIVNGHTSGFNSVLTTTAPDNYLAFNSNAEYVKMNPAINSIITNEVTVAVWVYGNPAAMA